MAEHLKALKAATQGSPCGKLRVMADWREQAARTAVESAWRRGWSDAKETLSSPWFVVAQLGAGAVTLLIPKVLAIMAVLAATVIAWAMLRAPLRQRDDARRCLRQAEDAVRIWCESHLRPTVTAEYVVPQAHRAQVEQDVFIFRNDSDLVAFNVTPHIEGIPPDTWVTWDDHRLLRLERSSPVSVSPRVYKQVFEGPDDNGISSHSVELEGTLFQRLRGLVRKPPYPQAWVLRITYNDQEGRTYETECEIVVDSDLGGILTRLSGKAGRLLDFGPQPSTVRRAAPSTPQGSGGGPA